MFGLIGWIGRVILILLIVRMVISMFSSSTRRRAPGAGDSNGSRGDRGAHSEKTVATLVRDPQCGTYVAENNSITASHGGATLHFCSERCRDEYLASPRATAV